MTIANHLIRRLSALLSLVFLFTIILLMASPGITATEKQSPNPVAPGQATLRETPKLI